MPELISAALKRLAREVSASEVALQASVETQLNSAVREGLNHEVFQLLEADVQSFLQALTSAVASIVSAAGAADARIERHGTVIAERHAIQEAEYRTIIAQSEEEGGRAAERVRLQTSLASAQSAANQRDAKEKQRHLVSKARGELLKRASELRDQRFALRKRVAERLTQQFGSIRVTVAQAAELQQYRELIVEALKGAGVKQGPIAERRLYAAARQPFADMRRPLACAAGGRAEMSMPTALRPMASYSFASVSAAAVMVATLIDHVWRGGSARVVRASSITPANAKAGPLLESEACRLLCGHPAVRAVLYGNQLTPGLPDAFGVTTPPPELFHSPPVEMGSTNARKAEGTLRGTSIPECTQDQSEGHARE